MSDTDDQHLDRIAIIGMAGRFPGAADVAQFWRNLRDGVESIRSFRREELARSGVEAAWLDDPGYVPANAVLDGVELFDAAFFGFSPREAEITDPQHRLFLECAWEALERSGYDSDRHDGLIGVFAGAGPSSYLLNHLIRRPEVLRSVSPVQLQLGNNKDFVPTRVSYKLNLKGPSVNVNTACSSSLVAVHLACQNLLDHQCDMALAGGVGIQVPQEQGYLYVEDGILSPDGHCRAFDAQARGTVGGNGVGIVVLKRLDEALADGDSILAVILGSAINNDGSAKVGFTAPSVDGQATVIAEALAIAGVDPGSIGYLEAHGTGTALGDPIEIAALTQAFGARTRETGFCALGSVKTNIGHLDEAAGVAGLIKTVLALQHRSIPPSLHYRQPNPAIDFARSPFYVNTELSPWPPRGALRRAGVSSFGIGGTNAHVVVQEAPPPVPSGDSRRWQLLPLSAKTPTALETATRNLADHLRANPGLCLADVAYTLQVGRRAFPHRRVVLCADADDAVGALESLDPARVLTGESGEGERPVVFLFPGQGAQAVGMGRELYRTEPAFAEPFDRCAAILRPHLGQDLRALVYPEGPRADADADAAADPLRQTAFAQPALFAVEYALAMLWMSWGIRPRALIGHSLGEYVAACLAGVFTLEEALALVAVRGRMMQGLPVGAMLAIELAEPDVLPLLGGGLSLALVNAPRLCVASGGSDAVGALERVLSGRGVRHYRLEPILAGFAAQVARVERRAPAIPFVSNRTGTWITAEEATDPGYWAGHLRHTVRFSEGVRELLKDPGSVFLEVGPGRTLTSLVRRQPGWTGDRPVLNTLEDPRHPGPDTSTALKALGSLWLAGVPVSWSSLHARDARRRLPLPTYPFERQRHWVDPDPSRGPGAGIGGGEVKKKNVQEWFYLPSWKRTLPPPPPPTPRAPDAAGARWLVFVDEAGLGGRLVERLEGDGRDVITVAAGPRFSRPGRRQFILDAGRPEDYALLRDELRAMNWRPASIVHLWAVSPDAAAEVDFESIQRRGLQSLLSLAHALIPEGLDEDACILVAADGLFDVGGGEAPSPEKATLLGPVRVLPQEYPGLRCSCVDVVRPRPGTPAERAVVGGLLREVAARLPDPVVVLRGGRRWVQSYEPVAPGEADGVAPVPRPGGVYLITGGLGGIGLILADHLARTTRGTLVLVGRTGVPGDDDAAAGGRPGDGGGPDGGHAPALDAEVALIGQAEERIERALDIAGLDRHDGLEGRIDRLCSAYAYRYLKSCGIEPRPGEVYRRSDLVERLRIGPRFERFFDHLVGILAEDGIVGSPGGEIAILEGARAVADPGDLLREALIAHPQFSGMLELLDHCAGHYGAALSGEIPAISVLYPDGESGLLERAGRRTVAHSRHEVYVQLLCETIVRRAAAAHPGGRLRILEVGAGDGLVARRLAPRLAGLGVEYVVTDLGRTFVAKLRRVAEAEGWSSVQLATLDIARDPVAQGFAASSFDVVFGLDVVHATRDVGRTISQLKTLLRPGGIVALVEATHAPRWTDLIWGLAEGWWAFEDRALRPRSPLLDLTRWEDLFRARGFGRVYGFPRDASQRSASDYGLVIAQADPAADGAAAPPPGPAGHEVPPAPDRRVERLRALRESAAECLVLRADVGDRRQMAAVVAETRRRYGRIDGVIHAAGLTTREAIFNTIDETGPSEVGALFHARVHGARVLADVLGGQELDFCLLISSNAAVLGGLGLCAYTAASAFLDALASRLRHRDGLPWISTNWDSWPTEEVTGRAADFHTSIDRFAMTRAEAVAAFDRAVAQDIGQLVVSAGDLGARLERWTKPGAIRPAGPPGRDPTRAAPPTRRPRADVPAPPGTPTERTLAAIWGDLLGIDDIGIHDNFFDLGGDSLLGTQLIAQIGRAFRVKVPFRGLFEGPTIAMLARHVETLSAWARELQTVPGDPLGAGEEEGEL
jgi:acyl transferase domain-containing protein/acyl carrier protein